MPAALFRQTRLDRAAHGSADVHARDRARRAGGVAGGFVVREDQAGALKAVRQTAGGEAHKALMPIGRACDNDRAIRVFDKRAIRPGRRLLHGFKLDFAAFAVQPVERLRDLACLQNVRCGQQPRAKPGIADAPARVDPGAQHETERVRRWRLVDSRRVAERLQAGILPVLEHLKPLNDEGAVHALQRHHIADRGERHHVEPAEKIRRLFLGVEALRPKLAL